MSTPQAGQAAPQERVVGAEAREEDRAYERVLRPTSFDDFVGQEKETANLRIFVEAARKRGEALDHVLLDGPPGLGKTTLAHIIGHELGVQVTVVHGPAVEHKGQLGSMLTKLEPRDVLFIDEIHRLAPVVEESLYTAIEDYRIDVTHGDGPYATTYQIPLPPFTLLGATTRTGLLTGPLRSRFGHTAHLEYYDAEALAKIVRRSAQLLELDIGDGAADEIAHRARGTPRIANRLLRRARDFAEVLSDGKLDVDLAREALDRLEVDRAGLDQMDRRLLQVVIEQYKGGPVGVDALAATLSEPRDTLEDVYEPYLLQQGFLARTSRGRTATDKAYAHLGMHPPTSQQRLL